MGTLDSLKRALRQKAKATASSPEQLLSDAQYSAGFDILVRGSGWMTYQRTRPEEPTWISSRLSETEGQELHCIRA